MSVRELLKLISNLIEDAGEPDYRSEALERHPEADFTIVFCDAVPVLIVPVSERARALAVRWGMPKDVTGIAPPPAYNDFGKSVPENWSICYSDMLDGPHSVAHIPLPQDRTVLH